MNYQFAIISVTCSRTTNLPTFYFILKATVDDLTFWGLAKTSQVLMSTVDGLRLAISKPKIISEHEFSDVY